MVTHKNREGNEDEDDHRHYHDNRNPISMALDSDEDDGARVSMSLVGIEQAQTDEEEEDEITRAMKMEVGQSLGILASVLKEVHAKEKTEAEKARAKAKQRAKAVARASAPLQTAERYDPTKEDARLLEVSSAQDGPKQQKTRLMGGRVVEDAAVAPAILKERAIEADLRVLGVIFRNREESSPAADTSPAAALVPQKEQFSFGFSLAGPNHETSLPSDSGNHQDTSLSVQEMEDFTEADGYTQEEDSLGEEKEEEGVGEHYRSNQEVVNIEMLELWPCLKELEETAKMFFDSRGAVGKGVDDQTLEEREAWKISRQKLMKDFKRRRRSAVRMRKSIKKKGAK